MNDETFLNTPGDSFAIYQLKHEPSTRDLRFTSMAQVEKRGGKVERQNYELMYVGKLQEVGELEQHAILEELYARFNLDIPADFAGHSLSMSDIVALRQSGHITFHYVDTFGFREVKDFLPDNLLHSAEIGLEDDYNMIDGIVGNNGLNPAKEEIKPDDRFSLREQLKQVMKEHRPTHHAERAEKLSVPER